MIVVMGATGTAGGAVARRLSRDGVRARVITRHASPGEGAAAHEVAVADLDAPASLDAAFAGAGRLFLASPASERLAARECAAIEAARRSGITEVVLLSAQGAAPGARSAVQRVHAEVEGELAASGMAWTVLRPSLFAQGLLAPIRATLAAGSWRAPAASGAAAWVDIRDVAAVAARLLRDGISGTAHAGRYLTLTGPEALTYRTLAVTLSVVAGRRITVETQPAGELREALLAAGRSPWLAEALVDLFAALEAGEMATVTSDIQEITGRVPLSFAQFVRDTRTSWSEAPR